MKHFLYFITILSVLSLLSEIYAKVILKVRGNIYTQNYNFHPGTPSVFYPRKKIMGVIDYSKFCTNFLIQYSCENPVKQCKWDMESKRCVKK